MATKLPSGRWRAQVFVGMENGKRIYKSFVEDTKERAELEARKFSASSPAGRSSPRRRSEGMYQTRKSSQRPFRICTACDYRT